MVGADHGPCGGDEDKDLTLWRRPSAETLCSPVQPAHCADHVMLEGLDHADAPLPAAVSHARRDGPIPSGHFRVVVCEADGRVRCHDFADLASARRYADDAASEAEHGPVTATVVGAAFELVHTGRHY